MGKWLERAAQLQRGAKGGDNRDVGDNSPIVPNVPNVPGSLPSAVKLGLPRLRGMAAPRIARPEVWPQVVADAARLANDGWAAQALALGWDPLHLWGCSPDPGGNVDHEGLAVWLRGRPVLLLDAHSCLVATGPRNHSIFNARPMPGAMLLWELGSGG